MEELSDMRSEAEFKPSPAAHREFNKWADERFEAWARRARYEGNEILRQGYYKWFKVDQLGKLHRKHLKDYDTTRDTVQRIHAHVVR